MSEQALKKPDVDLNKSSYTEGRDLRFITSPEQLMEELDVVEARYRELNLRVENSIHDIEELGAPSGDANMLTIAEICEELGVLAVIAEDLYLSLMTLYELKVHQFANRNDINAYTRMARNCEKMAAYYRAKVSEHAYDAELFSRAYRPDEDAKLARICGDVQTHIGANVSWLANPEGAAA